uniref:Uncharacterized protein n=1 Tax=Musa acuminata subsp. malaccensis TaxID=214687 RepID=A0A804HUB6_MUSAM
MLMGFHLGDTSSLRFGQSLTSTLEQSSPCFLVESKMIWNFL